jgi:3-hydroxybutyryl-CoA dehydrogenase
VNLEDVNEVGVIGAGAVGSGIAINFALWGYPTLLCDLSNSILQRSIKNIKSAVNVFVEEGLITKRRADDTFRRIKATTDLSRVAANSDFITESIVERTEDKRELFNKLDRLCPPQTILVSSTSWLLISDFGSDVKRQDKIAITHYFLPAHIVPGVEVSRGPGTSDETFNITYNLMKKTGKVPIRILKELPGCLLNRIQNAIRLEAYRLWADGVATAEDIEIGVRTTFGFRMPYEGPMMHYDLSGMWRQPEDVRSTMAGSYSGRESNLSAEVAEKIKRRMAEGKPWFIDPEKFDEVNEKKERAFVRLLKEWYWPRKAKNRALNLKWTS